jgi:hypothetical protein
MKNQMYVLAFTNSFGCVPGDFVEKIDVDTHALTWTGSIKKAMQGTLKTMIVLAELLNSSTNADRVVLVQADSYLKPKYATK